jgi:hypothetical protein
MVVFGLLNGIILTISGFSENIFNKKQKIGLTEEEKELLEVIEELEEHYLSQGLNPDDLTLNHVFEYIEEQENQSNLKKYSRFKKHLKDFQKKNPKGIEF